ncbi:unnamed protein product [Cylindrotheca closterium]|uniref:phosphoglucomutase (alpha-D-glucose-1,6-bisphosphate-dependent) n=1 Tax=Cylindrotheca closterium TaxID=2856 RepID=A0AAD2FSG7_9STRA|nr:unnamed protein product [Cylindrotheca closterium]
MTITWVVKKKSPTTKVGVTFISINKLVAIKSVSGRAAKLTDLVPGLRVFEINGKTVQSAKQACDIIRKAPIGDIRITTGGQHHSAVKISEERTGFTIRQYENKQDCVLITHVDPFGLFPDVPTGYFLWSINGKRMKSVNQTITSLKREKSVAIVIARPQDLGYDLGPLKPTTVKTRPIEGQKPGTSGLRKKTKRFMESNYLENFVQSTFNAIKARGTNIVEGTLLIGGDGRYFNKEAIQTIIKMAVANGVKRIWVGQDGLMSTPAISATIRERGPIWQQAFGAFILTASHNPGGPDEDFGIKYNCENGGPAPDILTNTIYENTTKIYKYFICPEFPSIDLSECGPTNVKSTDGMKQVCVEVISSTENHVTLLKSIFDFDAIRGLLDRNDFSMVYDAMHGVNGPYAKKVFVDELGQPESVCMNCVPKDDFNGAHADPNLTYAKELVELMGLDRKGAKIDTGAKVVQSFGAAADGDGDRNMILGTRFFVSPSDSLAVIASYAHVIPFFRSQGGLKGVARSMPTSGAVDLVAKDLGFDVFETPTGWKYFGNLMDSKAIFQGKDYTPFICGEESFGTGSDHVREKDGLWAVLAWLSILAYENSKVESSSKSLLSILAFDSSNKSSNSLVTVEDIVKGHWAKYGRNYYCRWDFEGVEKAGAEKMMDKMRESATANTGKEIGQYRIAKADDFSYKDPVDGTVAKKQGIRFLMEDGSRIIFRLSGTAGSGATVRMYIEQYEKEKIDMIASEALDGLVKVALELSAIKTYIGTDEPTVIT